MLLEVEDNNIRREGGAAPSSFIFLLYFRPDSEKLERNKAARR